MNHQLKNKIEATDTSINNLLKEQKFTIDYFQREYRWQEKHIKLLVEDLTSTFLKSFNPEHKPKEVANYQNYYLGPVVFSINPETGKKSIIDGQQRITSITLLLIFLNHLQKDLDDDEKVSITDLIFSVKHREKSFNMSDDLREPCLKALFEKGEYVIKEEDDETIKNMVARYSDIEECFPEEITQQSLPFFIDWLKENVIIVEITAYSDDNAYLIFETMNDRGLNLTPTEMLKGYVLSRIKDKTQRNEINAIWKEQIQKLHEIEENKDQAFFQAWFRSKYANSIRPGKADSEDKDFELIGSRFHNWFKDNHRSLFKLDKPEEFYFFFKHQFPFFVKWYIEIWNSGKTFNPKIPHSNYIAHWGIGESLQNPLLLAAIKVNDDQEIIEQKIDFISRYIETFTVIRSVNYRKFGAASIRYTMFNLIKLLRDNDIETLMINLQNEVNKLPEKWSGILEFGLNQMNRPFVKHLLARITSQIDILIGKESTYSMYHHPVGKPFEIEHIWAKKFEQHRDEFEQENDFLRCRNLIGALILLPQGTNQSFNSDRYEDKIEHYLKENTLAQSLHPNYYVKNPNFLKSQKIQSLDFKAHPEFKKADIEERQKLIQRICEFIWSVDNYKN